ncbi:hypothetical protein [Halobellus ruber]|uniref:Uncharacterized protein n=1 Tax=Halobellus ruber TaxID=2761102 RepID=A0A7J9SHG3_9EURY|nr:hypothetical protein [Halobellus ruber]MBB6645407.1 hypothetical protein [Halobellus ruber]
MTTPGTIDASDGDRNTYHIVCHDCPTEFLTDGRTEAEQRLSEHRRSTDHSVEFASLGVPEMENE